MHSEVFLFFFASLLTSSQTHTTLYNVCIFCFCHVNVINFNHNYNMTNFNHIHRMSRMKFEPSFPWPYGKSLIIQPSFHMVTNLVIA